MITNNGPFRTIRALTTIHPLPPSPPLLSPCPTLSLLVFIGQCSPLSQATISRNDIDVGGCGIVSIHPTGSLSLSASNQGTGLKIVRDTRSGKLDSGAAIMRRTKRHRMSEAIYTSSRGAKRSGRNEKKGGRERREKERREMVVLPSQRYHNACTLLFISTQRFVCVRNHTSENKNLVGI